jgi:nucleoside-diphosphate-sugar epimerase
VNVTITGGLGFLGRLLARRLTADRHEVVLFDVEGPPDEPGLRVVRGQVNDAAAVGAAVPPGTDAVVHLASMVSAECELDFDAALMVNLDGTRTVLEAARQLPTPPRFLFASSVAVFGAAPGEPMAAALPSAPDTAGGDTVKQLPVTTYGSTKAIGELLVNDYTRKGFIDGCSARLPTVVIRPGRPNAAASAFASGVFREPLAGQPSVVPVDPSTPVVVIGHRTAVEGLVGLLLIEGSRIGADRAVGLPALEVTVAEMIAASNARAPRSGLIETRPDPLIQAVVGSWPGKWESLRARALGLPEDTNLDDIIDAYLQDFT